MTVPTGTRNKHDEYTRYADHCLKMAKQNLEHDSRMVLREMANEWLKLADNPLSEKPRLGL
ncbi:MAG: hypothetical protein QOF09_4595 [Alphaproteobacteria bacterium]|jgi:uncharacterized protein YaeQ|nr:hypothetical protein [Alphaproteobacteria bacterium]